VEIIDVPCRSNHEAIVVVADHIDGGKIKFEIEPERALIDEAGCIRCFYLDWGDNKGVHGYQLHPYYSKTRNVINHAEEFLAGFGVRRIQGELLQLAPKIVPRLVSRVVPPAAVPAVGGLVTVASLFLFNRAATHIIRTCVYGQGEELGYHNVMTDKLIWPSPIYVRSAPSQAVRPSRR